MMQSVQVIIERLKTHPEDFFGDFEKHLGRTPKFIDITEKIDDLLTDKDKQYVHRLWYLEPEEKEALIAAYKEARRARFEANVFHTLLTKQEPDDDTVKFNTKDRYSLDGKRLMQGPSSIIAPQKIINESLELLNREFDAQYAKNRNT
jgi:predicted Zn-dependent protease